MLQLYQTFTQQTVKPQIVLIMILSLSYKRKNFIKTDISVTFIQPKVNFSISRKQLYAQVSEECTQSTSLTGDNSVKNCGLFVFLFFRKHYFASFKHKNFCALFEAYESVSTHEEEKIYISLACSVSQQRVPKHLSRDVEKYCFDVCLKKRKTFCFHFRQEYRTSCQDLAFRRQDKFTERSSKALEKFGIRFQKIENALKRSAVIAGLQ